MKIIPRTIPGPPVADAVVLGDILMCTVVPEDSSGELAGKTIEEQTRVIFDNLSRILQENGGTLADTAHVTVYLPDIADRTGMTQVWTEVFPTNPPGRATIGVAALAHPDMKIEISCIAHLARATAAP